jgi:branched-chain amino acid transport system ATP-binding protein
VLELSDLAVRFGGVTAVDGVSLAIAPGELAALIGPNGAGKTTLFALVSGFVRPDRGRVRFLDRDIVGQPPHAIARLGMARTFQIVQPFASQTVRENIAVGAHLHHRARAAALDVATEVAKQVGLGPMLDTRAENLTLAGRKRLELARALATGPKLLLLDEVLAGLNPHEVADVVPVVAGIRESGVTVLMIEHVMQAVMSLADRVHVLANGRLIASGSPREVTADPGVIEAYLGRAAATRLRVHG